MSLGNADNYVVDEDDDLNEDDIPGFSHPALATAAIPDKGKSRAQPEPEQLAPPSSRPGPAVSGNIGSSSQTTEMAKLRLLSSLIALFFIGGFTGALGFKHLGFFFTLPLAALLLILAAVPIIDDIRRHGTVGAGF